MKLSVEMLESICLGAVRITDTGSGVRLYRFTEEQELLYREKREDLYMKLFTSAGMKLQFETNSENLFIRVHITPCSSRKYFSFEVKVNGKNVGSLDNYSDQERTSGVFSEKFKLGRGMKLVCVYLPWSVSVEIQELSLDDGTFLRPIRPAKKLLALGDSITQGYDALRPSSRYASRLAEMLDAEEINKGIGGEKFFPELAGTQEVFTPDYITVAYGTNDWRSVEEADFLEQCRAFYEALSRNYPYSKIFAITPIWRKDCNETTIFGPFKKVEENIQAIVENFENITCICGCDLVPQDEKYFADLRLHPNDAGFVHYADALYSKIVDKL